MDLNNPYWNRLKTTEEMTDKRVVIEYLDQINAEEKYGIKYDHAVGKEKLPYELLINKNTGEIYNVQSAYDLD